MRRRAAPWPGLAALLGLLLAAACGVKSRPLPPATAALAAPSAQIPAH